MGGSVTNFNKHSAKRPFGNGIWSISFKKTTAAGFQPYVQREMANIRKTRPVPTHPINMKPIAPLAASLWLVTLTAAHATDAKYRQALERSGCTQVSEMQGCDINKTRAENAKAGFVTDAAAPSAPKAAPTAKPSFDCAKAKPGSTEALICADPALAALDRQLADVYAAARKKAANQKPPVLQAEQRGWVKGRDDCWKAQQSGQATCIRDAYQQRIIELQARYRLVAAEGPVFLACDGDPRNEVVITRFRTEPPSLIAERGDQSSLMVRQIGEGERYQGRNETLVQQGAESLVTWGDQAPVMRCRAAKR